MKKPTMKNLRRQRKEQNALIWEEFGTLRKQHHEKMDAAKESYNIKIESSKNDFIESAIEKSGEPELADQMILDTVFYDHLSRQFLYINGELHSKIKSFHTTALLRNEGAIQEKFSKNTLHMNAEPDLQKELLILSELFTGGACPKPNREDIEALEEEFEEIEKFKRELRGKTADDFDEDELNLVHEKYISDVGMRSYMPVRKTEPMTEKQAKRIVKEQERALPRPR